MLSALQLTGRCQQHLQTHGSQHPQLRLQAEVWPALAALQAAAAAAGLELAVASAFRDFDRQLAIWNRKFSGAATLYNEYGEALDASSLSVGEKVHAILTWSALPGASRHHWGTDLDVYDPRWFAATQQPLQLIAAEYEGSGPCAELACWLRQHAADYGFFLPYQQYRGGVAAEPWHLSYAPLATVAQAQHNVAVLADALAPAPLLGKDFVLAQLDEIYQRYISNICLPDAQDSTVWLG